MENRITEDEKRAKFVLEKLEIYDKLYLENKDRPDLIAVDNKVGIEVTRSINKGWAETDSKVKQYFGKSLNGHEIKRQIENSCKKGFRGYIEVFNDVAVFSPTKGLVSISVLVDKLIDDIHKKISKSDNYSKVDSLSIYVIVDTFVLMLHDVKRIQNKIEFWENFDTIYIDNMDCLYVLNKKNIQKFDIT